MRKFACVFVFVALVHLSSQQQYTEEQQKRIAKFRNECTEETKVDPELITKADQGNFVEDDKLKCFAKCFYKKVGFINDNAEVQPAVIEAKLPQGIDKVKALEVINICKELKGKDACEKAFVIHKCFFEHNKKYTEEQAKLQASKGPASAPAS